MFLKLRPPDPIQFGFCLLLQTFHSSLCLLYFSLVLVSVPKAHWTLSHLRAFVSGVLWLQAFAWFALLSIQKISAQCLFQKYPSSTLALSLPSSCFLSFIALSTTWNYTLYICFTFYLLCLPVECKAHKSRTFLVLFFAVSPGLRTVPGLQ